MNEMIHQKEKLCFTSPGEHGCSSVIDAAIELGSRSIAKVATFVGEVALYVDDLNNYFCVDGGGSIYFSYNNNFLKLINIDDYKYLHKRHFEIVTREKIGWDRSKLVCYRLQSPYLSVCGEFYVAACKYLKSEGEVRFIKLTEKDKENYIFPLKNDYDLTMFKIYINGFEQKGNNEVDLIDCENYYG